MGYALTANPNRHYYATRRSPILGIVLHVTAGLEDFTPPDSGAEATVRYGQSNRRPASWHGIVDSDSVIDCLPDSFTAFHVIGYNSSTLGLEIANRDARWAGKPSSWVDGTIANAAEWCRPRVDKYGLPVQLANKAQVDAAIRAGRPFGFTYHRYLDPKRRIDPGRDFPWEKFAALVRDPSAGVRPVTTVDPGRIEEDGVLGAATKARVAHLLAVPEYTDASWWRAVQAWAGLTGAAVDGVPGPVTWDAVRRKVGSGAGKVPGIVRALQGWCNRQWSPVVVPSVPGVSRPVSVPKRPAGPVAPPWPLPSTHLIGPNPHRRVTWHDGHGDDARGRDAIRTWQQQMKTRGWSIKVDGLWGNESTRVLRAFQAEKRLGVDGILGPNSWRAAWTEGITR